MGNEKVFNLASNHYKDELMDLLSTGFNRRQLPVRLLGAGVRLAERKKPSSLKQLSLFDSF